MLLIAVNPETGANQYQWELNFRVPIKKIQQSELAVSFFRNGLSKQSDVILDIRMNLKKTNSVQRNKKPTLLRILE